MGRGEVFAAVVTGTTLLGATVVVTTTLVFVWLAAATLDGAVRLAPHEHFPFFPAISGFQRNVLPHAVQEKLESIACAMAFPVLPAPEL
jgi:hypothetical protein